MRLRFNTEEQNKFRKGGLNLVLGLNASQPPNQNNCADGNDIFVYDVANSLIGRRRWMSGSQ
jgi:hypothetical protein